ncbi:MAG: hypothetical protein SGJ19_15250 [Planctomycetia bacterium]|nr:hypothetical protein [Planctomycetia bacterium]
MAPGSKLSTANLNNDLRMLKRALRTAERWGYIDRAPPVTFARMDLELPRIIAPDDFTRIYAACDAVTLPAKLGCEPADWWRALHFTAFTTGWRIGVLLSMRRADVDFETGEVSLCASNTKGRKPAGAPSRITHRPRLGGPSLGLARKALGKTRRFSTTETLCVADSSKTVLVNPLVDA